MNDFNYSATSLIQHATGSITYGVPVAGDTVIVNGTTFTCVAAAPGAGEFSNITELEALVEAVAGINSSVSGGTINIEAATPGTAGNAITLAVGGGNTGTLSVSGATLTGGVDQTYTDAFQLEENYEEVDVALVISALTGAAATVTVTPQVSFDKTTWIDRTATAALNSTGTTELHVSEPLTYMRFKIVLGGTTPTTTLAITARASRG